MLQVPSFKFCVELVKAIEIAVRHLFWGFSTGVSTYELGTDNVPVLSIVLVMGIFHQSVVLENRDPILVVFHFFTLVRGPRRWDELLHRDGVSVEVLQGDVREERNLVVLVERQVDVVGAWPLSL